MIKCSKVQMFKCSNVPMFQCPMSTRLNFCRNVPLEFLRSFLVLFYLGIYCKESPQEEEEATRAHVAATHPILPLPAFASIKLAQSAATNKLGPH